MRSGLAALALALLAYVGVQAQPTEIELWSNNAVSRLASGVTAAATTFVVEAGHGARFPSPGAGQYFWATVQSGPTLEIVQCTARSTDTMTCTRAQQGTTASAFATGATFENRLTRETLRGLWAGWNLIDGAGPDTTGHVAIGNDANIDHDVDTTILTLKDIQTQTIDHAIGLSSTIIWAPTANANSRNIASGDFLSVPSPRTGVTIPEAIAVSENHWFGHDGAAAAGTVTKAVGYRVNNPIRLPSSAVSVTTNYGIEILDQRTIADVDANFQPTGTFITPTETAAILTANGNWFSWRNAANTATVPGLRMNDQNRLEFGALTANTVAYAASTGTVGTAYELADGAITRTLPAAAACTGCAITVSAIATSAGVVTVASGGGSIIGPTALHPGMAQTYISNGLDWFAVGGNPNRRVSGATAAAGPETTYQRLTASQAVTVASLTTVMTTTGLTAGHYTFSYQLIFQSAATTTGMGVGVNHTGTTSHFLMFCRYPTTGGAAASNTHDSVTSTAGGQLVEAKAERVKNTSSSASVGVADAGVDQIVICDGTVTASTGGDLELRVLTEIAGSAITVQPNTSLKLERVGQ